jgi:hypothetical protein
MTLRVSNNAGTSLSTSWATTYRLGLVSRLSAASCKSIAPKLTAYLKGQAEYGNQRFLRRWTCPYWSYGLSSALKVEAVCSCKSTRGYNPEDQHRLPPTISLNKWWLFLHLACTLTGQSLLKLRSKGHHSRILWIWAKCAPIMLH